MHCPYCLASRCIVWHPGIEAPAQDTAATADSHTADSHTASNVYTRYASQHTYTYTPQYPQYTHHCVTHTPVQNGCRIAAAPHRNAVARSIHSAQYTQFIYYTGQYTGQYTHRTVYTGYTGQYIQYTHRIVYTLYSDSIQSSIHRRLYTIQDSINRIQYTYKTVYTGQDTR